MKNAQQSNYLYILILIIFFGCILRAYHFYYHSLWLDEMMQVMVASTEWKNFFHQVSLHSSPPLDYILMKCVILMFGKADWVVRMPALVYGVASLPAFYYLVRSLTNQQNALIATTLLAFSPMAILYAQEARMYSLFLLLSLISYSLTLLLIEKNNFKSSLLLGLINGLLILTHYFGIFVIVLETSTLIVLSVFSGRRKIAGKLVVASLVLPFFIFLPWLPSFLSAQINIEIPYALQADRYFFKTLLIYFTSLTGTFDAWLCSHVLAFATSILLAYRNNEKKILAIALGFFGILGILFGIAFFRRIITERNLIFLLPLFLLVCSYSITALLTHFRIKPLAGIFIVACLLFWPGSRDHSAYRKTNWRGAAQYIQHHVGKKEKVVTTDFISRASLAYYLVPGADYVIMRKHWLETTNDPGWRIWVINDALLKQIQAKQFAGWVVIPPDAFKVVSRKTLANYNKILGHPAKQFKLGKRNLNIYYLQPINKTITENTVGKESKALLKE